MILLLLVVTVALATGPWPRSPVIGVMMAPTSTEPHLPQEQGKSYVPSSYVLWVQSSGAYDLPAQNVTRLVTKELSGLVLPGGAGGVANYSNGDYAPFYQNIIPALALAQKLQMPVYSECLGYEFMLSYFFHRLDMFGSFRIKKTSLPLNFTDIADSASPFMRALTQNAAVRGILASEDVTYNNHNFGVDPEKLAGQSTVRVLATSSTPTAGTFVSHVEAVAVPFYGAQFHAEKKMHLSMRRTTATTMAATLFWLHSLSQTTSLRLRARTPLVKSRFFASPWLLATTHCEIPSPVVSWEAVYIL